jgi:lipoate-protein ligase A
MAIDHAMLDLAESTGALLWRAYRWDPWCLSFGRHEPASRRYHRAEIERLGLDCVRRPTGGRAVWHARELTYAVAGPIAALGSLREAYHRIHQVLAAAVRVVSGAAELAPARATPGLGSGPCFASPVGGEVVVDARKVVGSAQRRGVTALLQHGSMLLEDDQSLVAALSLGDLPVSSEATLSSLAGRPVGFDEAAAALATALESSLPLRPAAPPPLSTVLRHALTYYDTYRSAGWTWAR